jgi:methionyl aminopeptidase
MHEEPQIPNYGNPGTGVPLEEGMVLAVEPMVTVGRQNVRMGDDHWAIYSQDGSLAAHFEFTIAVTAAGPRILTPWHEAGNNGRAAA